MHDNTIMTFLKISTGDRLCELIVFVSIIRKDFETSQLLSKIEDEQSLVCSASEEDQGASGEIM